MSEVKTACLYVRYSSANQSEQSIEGQVRVCTEYAVKHDYKIVEIYADRATSASKDIEKRTEFLRMIKDSEKHLFDVVIVYKLDRFARNRYDSANFKYRLRKNGVQLISATENISTEPEGIILESVLEGMAEFYSAELSQKITRGLRESAYKHNSVGGHIPLGYKVENKKLVIDEETAPIVREAFQLFANGKTVSYICKYFNEKGYITSKGTSYNKSSFANMFRNEKYIGTYSYHDYKAENVIPPIIDREIFEMVQLRLKERKHNTSSRAKTNYLLSGKVFCGHCGSKLIGSSTGADGRYYYLCSGRKHKFVKCNKKGIRKEYLETIVATDAIQLLTDENIELIAQTAVDINNHEIESTTHIPAIKSKLEDIKKNLNNLLKAVESGEAPEILIKRMNELEKEKRNLEKQLSEEEKGIVYLDKYRIIYWLEQFKNGDIHNEDVKRNIINLFVNSVTVYDEDKKTYKIVIGYNLSNLQTKTYHLKTDGTFENVGQNLESPSLEVSSNIFFHTIWKAIPRKRSQELLL